MKPKLAAFPKCYMDELCVHRTMTLGDWIEIGATLGVEGLEFYSGFIEDNEAFLREAKESLEKHELQMPMLCCSPDFTEPDGDLLEEQIARERRMIEITAFFGGRFCRENVETPAVRGREPVSPIGGQRALVPGFGQGRVHDLASAASRSSSTISSRMSCPRRDAARRPSRLSPRS